MAQKISDSADYGRMAKELEAMADMIQGHLDKSHPASQRLKEVAADMRSDAKTAFPKVVG